MNEIDKWLYDGQFTGQILSAETLTDCRCFALVKSKPGGRAVDERLVGLAQNALTAQSLANSYLHIARRFVAAARSARQAAQPDPYAMHLQQAREAHEQARKCLSFARLCRQRAEGMESAKKTPADAARAWI